MRDPLRECIDNFGHAPRQFSLWDRMTYLRVRKPTWLRCTPSDDLNILFRHRRSLFVEGTVVWGHVIQANSQMFEDGTVDCPGEVVYSIADSQHAHTELLQQIAYELFSLKGTEPDDPDLAPIAHYLTDEMVRVFGLAVPRGISPTASCKISTTLFVRAHLPYRRLCSSLLPIVVSPGEPHVALPLPARYWPPDLVEWWAS